MDTSHIISVLVSAILMLPALSGCRGSHSDIRDDAAMATYNMGECAKAGAGDVFSGVEPVVLRWSEDNNYPNIVVGLSVTDSLIMVNDKSELLHLFDRNGGFMTCSKEKMGYGPGEYSVFMGCTHNPFKGNISLLTPDRLMEFDTRMNHLSSHALNTTIGEGGTIYNGVIALKDGNYMLQPAIHGLKSNSVALYDPTEEAIVKEFSYMSDVVLNQNMQPTHFFRMPDGEILYCPGAYTGYIYGFDESGGKFNRRIRMDFGEGYVTKADVSDIAGDIDAESMYVYDPPRPLPVTHLVNSGRIITLVKHGPKLSDSYYIVTDRYTGHSKRVETHTAKGYQLPMLWNMDERYAYGIARRSFIAENPEMLMERADEADSLLADINDDDYILLKYIIRQEDQE